MSTKSSEDEMPLTEQAAEDCAFMRAVVAGLADLDAGREVTLAEAKARFGLE